MKPNLSIRGFQIYEKFLDDDAQRALTAELRALIVTTPMVQPVLAGGRRMSVRMTSLGKLGWVADAAGYKYQSHHPNGQPWPAIPPSVLNI